MKASLRWLFGIVVVGWVAVCVPLLRSEFMSVATMRTAWTMTETEKRDFIDGPIYEFLENARDLIPGDPQQEVHLFAVDDGYTYYKSNYYLYPRTLYLMDPATSRARPVSPGAYFVFFIPQSLATKNPDGIKRDFDRIAASLPPVVKLYRTPNAGIYRVGPPHG